MSGILFSLLSAFFWATAVILFRKSGEHFSPLGLNLFKTLVSLLLFIPTVLVLQQPVFIEITRNDVWILTLSGMIGVGLADSFFFASLSRLGAGLSAIVACLYLPSVIGLSYLFLGETLAAPGVIGGLLVFSALVIASRYQPAQEISPRDLVVGLLYGLIGIFSVAVGIVIIKPILVEGDVIWVSTYRILTGALTVFLIVLVHPSRKTILRELRPSPSWKWAVPGAVMGNYVAMIFWLAGMKYTLVSLAAILNQLSTVLIFVFATLFLRERMTRVKIIAIFLAVSGAVVAIFN